MEEQTKDKLFKIFLLVIGLLIVIGLFLNAYLLLRKEKPPKVAFPPTPAPTQIPPSPTLTPDPTAGWKIYRNERYGFEFKHPQGWIYNLQAEKEISQKGDSPQIIRTQIAPFSLENDVSLVINIWENPSRLSTVNWLKEYQKEIQSVFVNAYVDKLPAFKDTSEVEAAENATKRGQRGGTAFPRITYYVAKSDKVYGIQLNNYSPEAFGYKNENIYDVFDLLISTFKFLP